MYDKDPFEEKYQFFIKNKKVQASSILMILKLLLNTQMVNLFNFNTQILRSKMLKNTIQEKRRKILVIFDAMIADILNNKTLSPIVPLLFI